MIELRCKRCSVLLLKEEIIVGSIEVKCRSCGTFNYISVDKYISKLDKSEEKENNTKAKQNKNPRGQK